jgi:hypothetical protein
LALLYRLHTLGTTAAKTFMEMEAAALKFRKVYGDLFTPQAETQAGTCRYYSTW